MENMAPVVNEVTHCNFNNGNGIVTVLNSNSNNSSSSSTQSPHYNTTTNHHHVTTSTKKHTEHQQQLPSIRSELFANTPITVFADEREALSVARDLAEMKTAQGDNYPFYVMDMGRLEYLHNLWLKHLPRVQPFYSIRCNADPVLLRLLVEQPDIGFYCTNRAELNLAMELADRKRVIYANPLWTRGSVRHACELGVDMLMFESREDLQRIHQMHPNASVVLRVCMNPPVNHTLMSAGCELSDEAPQLLSMAADLDVKVVGISFSIGAGACSVGIYSYAIAQARRLFDIGMAMGHHDMHVLDVGGGFQCGGGGGGGTTTQGPSFAQIALAINECLDEYFDESLFENLRIIAEPGRYFAASLFSLVTNIVDKRAVDASMLTNDVYDSGAAGYVYQTNEGFYGSFGCRLASHCEPKCRPLMMDSSIQEHEEQQEHDLSANNNEYTYATILGPTLSNDVDVLQSVARLPQMQIGEWLLWDDMGAYSMGNRETLGEDSTATPTVYYFVGNERWQHMLRRYSAERESSPIHEVVVSGSGSGGSSLQCCKCAAAEPEEEEEVDTNSLGVSTEEYDSASAITDDEHLLWTDLMENWPPSHNNVENVEC